MAESLSMIAGRVTIPAAAFVWALCVCAIDACADNLPDPTRPPAALGVALEGAAESSAVLRLQSVLIAPGRRIAIVNGQAVQLGGKVGEARVVAISEGEIVLRNGKDLQIVKLFPEVEKRPVAGSVISKSHFGNQPDKR